MGGKEGVTILKTWHTSLYRWEQGQQHTQWQYIGKRLPRTLGGRRGGEEGRRGGEERRRGEEERRGGEEGGEERRGREEGRRGGEEGGEEERRGGGRGGEEGRREGRKRRVQHHNQLSLVITSNFYYQVVFVCKLVNGYKLMLCCMRIFTHARIILAG